MRFTRNPQRFLKTSISTTLLSLVKLAVSIFRVFLFILSILNFTLAKFDFASEIEVSTSVAPYKLNLVT